MIKDLQLPPQQKLYFASDFHLGEPDYQTTRIREGKVISWLDQCKHDAAGIFLLGDIFDFWFEYRHVIPKGYTRLLGKLAEISDSGIPIYFFTGNHDMWLFDYMPKELNITVFKQPQSITVNGQRLMIGHGDGLGPGERSYKILKLFFANRVCQWFFRWLHPNLGFALANFWSRQSRNRQGMSPPPFVSAEKELIFQYCKTTEQQQHHDFYIFGHRHLPLELPINETAVYFNIGEWLIEPTYGVFNGQSFKIHHFK